MTDYYWPYDEAEFEIKDRATGAFTIKTPWLVTEIEVKPGSPEFIALETLSIPSARAELAPSMQFLPVLARLFAKLSHLPVAYQLPRQTGQFGADAHRVRNPLTAKSPKALAIELGLRDPELYSNDWNWDHEAVLSFSACGDKIGYDPYSILSVARRFHALDTHQNEIGEVYARVEALTDEEKRKKASAVIVRQNHFVTARCQDSLRPALDIAQSQEVLVRDFMDEEKGHDAILGGGLRAMGEEASKLPVMPATENLMELLRICATRNFLAFCLSLDFFEKPQFKDEDSLAEMLKKVDQSMAARALQAHKNINDHGEHEGFSVKLLESMQAVDRPYGLEALRLSELVSTSIAQVPRDLSKFIFESQ